jgi:hypothetical protein
MARRRHGLHAGRRRTDAHEDIRCRNARHRSGAGGRDDGSRNKHFPDHQKISL